METDFGVDVVYYKGAFVIVCRRDRDYQPEAEVLLWMYHYTLDLDVKLVRLAAKRATTCKVMARSGNCYCYDLEIIATRPFVATASQNRKSGGWGGNGNGND